MKNMENESEDNKKLVTIDEAIPYIGEFKKFQWIVGAMFCTIMLPTTYQILITVFGALDPTWRCVDNSTLCLKNGTFSPHNPSRCTLPRSEWQYTEPREYSLVTYFDIYCDNSWLIQLSTSILFIGSGVGGLFVGWAADNYGRKNIIFVSTAIVLLCGFVTPFMPNIHLVICLRFIIGFFLAGTNVQMAILLSEIVASKYRPHAGIMVWIFFSVALCLLSLKAYLIRSWKILFIVCTVPYIFVLLFYKFVPESPRWLRLRGKLDELMETLRRVARINNKDMPLHIGILPVDEHMENRKSSPLQLFRTRKIGMISLVTGYGTFAHGIVYYGLHMAANDLGGSLYLNFFLLSLIEVPATVSAIFVCDRFGRKYPTIAGAFSAGISCIVIASLPIKMKASRVIVGMIGKLSIAISFNTIAVWIMELFPTVVRAQAMGFVTVTTRIGATSAPWLISELSSLHQSGPYICMAVAVLICAGLLCLLKETKGLSTLETEKELNKRLTEEELLINSETLLT